MTQSTLPIPAFNGENVIEKTRRDRRGAEIRCTGSTLIATGVQPSASRAGNRSYLSLDSRLSQRGFLIKPTVNPKRERGVGSASNGSKTAPTSKFGRPTRVAAITELAQGDGDLSVE